MHSKNAEPVLDNPNRVTKPISTFNYLYAPAFLLSVLIISNGSLFDENLNY